MRPKTIVYFEWIIFGGLLVDTFWNYLEWDRLVWPAQVKSLLVIYVVPLTIIIGTFVLFGVLTLLVSRRRNKIAMWVSIALFAIGLSVWFARPPTADELLGSDTILSALQTIGQGVAYYLLFTPSARRWMNREDKVLEVFH